MEPPPPVIIEKPKNRPIITKPQGVAPRRGNTPAANDTSDETDGGGAKGSIISKWAYTKKVQNGFYP